MTETGSGYQRYKKSNVLTAILNTEHEAVYSRVSEKRWRGVSKSTRIAEVKNMGKSNEKELPVGNDSGFLWRLNAYWRLEEADGGVFVECETISLSRSMPFALGWLIKPFVEQLPRQALEETLQATRLAVAGESPEGP